MFVPVRIRWTSRTIDTAFAALITARIAIAAVRRLTEYTSRLFGAVNASGAIRASARIGIPMRTAAR